MNFRSQSLLLAAFATILVPSYADDGLTQTTISIYADGKPVAGVIVPIAVKLTPSAVANHIDMDAKETRYAGNVEGRLSLPATQDIIFFGEKIAVATEPISAERAKAVKDIEAMASSDQLYRGGPLTKQLTADEWKQQTAIDVANMRRLSEIIDEYGWPGLRFAGAASQTAFLVLQHAGNASQRKYLPLLRDAVKRNDALGADLALLEDRLRVADGKPQLYGSQLSGKPLRFDPIENEAHVDERRRSVGLAPLADYAKLFGLTYIPGTVKVGDVAHQ
jgi:hypothetical protein